MNLIALHGNVVDPGELREVGEDQKVRTIRIAHNQVRPGKEDKPPLFLDVTIWNGWAENFEGEKGDALTVSGRLASDAWKAEDGSPRTKLFVKASEVRLLRKNPNAPSA